MILLNSKNPQSGFSLIEVMVVQALIVINFFALMSLQSIGTDNQLNFRANSHFDGIVDQVKLLASNRDFCRGIFITNGSPTVLALNGETEVDQIQMGGSIVQIPAGANITDLEFEISDIDIPQSDMQLAGVTYAYKPANLIVRAKKKVGLLQSVELKYTLLLGFYLDPTRVITTCDSYGPNQQLTDSFMSAMCSSMGGTYVTGPPASCEKLSGTVNGFFSVGESNPHGINMLTVPEVVPYLGPLLYHGNIWCEDKNVLTNACTCTPGYVPMLISDAPEGGHMFDATFACTAN